MWGSLWARALDNEADIRGDTRQDPGRLSSHSHLLPRVLHGFHGKSPAESTFDKLGSVNMQEMSLWQAETFARSRQCEVPYGS